MINQLQQNMTLTNSIKGNQVDMMVSFNSLRECFL